MPIIKERMMTAAKEKKFELAAKLRDHCVRLEAMQQKQTVSDATGADTDVIGVSVLSNRAYVVLLQERGGKVIADLSFPLQGAPENVCDVLEQFVPQYYASTEDIPRTILLPEKCEGQNAMAALISEQAERKVEIVVPERGKKNSLMDLAMRNAAQKAKQAEASWEAEARNVSSALGELKDLLGLKAEPKRIEGYDISHLGGTETVGSMVVMCDGKPANKHYRHFTIHGLKKGEIDDYRSLREVLSRRLRYVAGGLRREEELWSKNGVTVGPARKADQEFLDRTFGEQKVSYEHVFVVRHENNVIAALELHPHSASASELCHSWIEEERGNDALLQFLTRKILKSVKKGKVYVATTPELEYAYNRLGFEPIRQVPKFFEDRADAFVMMWEASENKPNASLDAIPDLLMIDGGKGQLGVVVEVLKEMNLDIPVISLAKREEEIFMPGNPISITVPKDSPGRFLLMRLRDEAHRFANRLREIKAKNTFFGK